VVHGLSKKFNHPQASIVSLPFTRRLGGREAKQQRLEVTGVTRFETIEFSTPGGQPNESISCKATAYRFKAQLRAPFWSMNQVAPFWPTKQLIPYLSTSML